MAPSLTVAASIAIFLAFNAVASPFGSPRRSHAERQHLKCEPESFTSILPANAVLENVAVVPDGASYGEGAANIPYPMNPTDLPALCAVTVRVRSSPTSSYRFGLFLPNKWHSRFLVVGNGVFAGGINWLDMAVGPRYGMASLSTDTGHNSSFWDTAWALNQPEKKADWGWRAIHGSTDLGKELVRAYYCDRPITYSYYSGCSTGGRQGLKELQNFPNSFDGALLGAPAWWMSHLASYGVQLGLYNLPDPKRLSATQISLLTEEATRQCDGLDALRDGIVSSPELCTLNFSILLCPNNSPNPSKCLTAAQISTAISIYNDWLSTNDSSLLYPGQNPSSERQWSTYLGGPEPFGVGFMRDLLFDDPTWDWRTFNESVVDFADAIDPGNSTADDYAALGEVRKRGGKVIIYHGMADELVPTKGTEVYYNRTLTALSRDVAGFLRFFLVPGMQHCLGTAVDAPWYFAGANQPGSIGSSVWSVPGFEDAEHDVMMALMDWVERGREVDKIIATTWRSVMDPTSGVRRQRPICPWPQKAVWDGKRDLDDAGSWRCSG